MSDKFLDVEKIITDKNPKLLKWMPGFAVNYIKRILHQKEMNEVISDFEDLKSSRFCTAVLDRFNIKVEVKGIEKVKKQSLKKGTPIKKGATIILNLS